MIRVTDFFSSHFEQDDPDDLTSLCLETVLAGHSALVFCPTKSWCENLAGSVARDFYKLGSLKGANIPQEISSQLRNELKGDSLAEVIEQLKRCPAGLDNNLARSISFGVAFHHAGSSVACCTVSLLETTVIYCTLRVRLNL